MNHPFDNDGNPWPVNRKAGHHPVVWIVRACVVLVVCLALYACTP